MNMTADKTVFITGSSKGIGRAIAIQLANDGYQLVLHYHQDKQGALATQALLADQQQASCRILQFDLNDRAACQQQLLQDIETHGAYYGVVCNAGITRDNAFPAMPAEDWDAVIHTNLDGFYNVLNPLIMPMVRQRKPARIITIASISGLMGNRGQVNYSAAKAGIIGATKALALELAKRKITVNCIAPGLIETDMINDVALDEALKMIPAKRLGKPEEVAGLVSYLCSESAAYVTRQVISVNGGMC